MILEVEWLSDISIFIFPIPISQVLIDHVCAFVENNQVQWMDLHSRPVKFNRSAILMELMVTLECFRFKEKFTAMQEGRSYTNSKIDNPFYLLAIFDEIMNTMAKANAKKVRRSLLHEIYLSLPWSYCVIKAHKIICYTWLVSDLDVQVHGHVSIPRHPPLILRNRTFALHLPCPRPKGRMSFIYEDSSWWLPPLLHCQEVGQASKLCSQDLTWDPKSNPSSLLWGSVG